MDLLETIRDILAGKRETCRILADWLEENKSDHPEFRVYHSRLIKPESLRLQTLLDVVIKFGDKKQRSVCAKMIRTMMRNKKRVQAKGTIRAYMKKSWSLNTDWFAVVHLKTELKVSEFLEQEAKNAEIRITLKSNQQTK